MTSALRLPYYSYLSCWFGVTSRRPIGTNIFSRDWDVLIVLDACRVDALDQVKEEYDFLPDKIDSIWSLGSGSAEWIAQTFSEDYADEIADTAYVSTNGFTEWVLNHREMPSEKGWFDISKWDTVHPEDFKLLHYIKDDAPELDFYRYVPTKYINERAIAAKQQIDPERLVIHYQQPHDPYAHEALSEGRELTEYEKKPLRHLARGECSREKAWGDYIQELRAGLDGVEDLLESIDADKVVITADHGEAFGEYNIHRHPLGIPIPELRRVPWVETSAERMKDVDVNYNFESDKMGTKDEILDHLANLGYR
ncbi:hypothetical protein C439_12554 [Haloferax mediterranei ATCC 33500]|uniref:Sulfatase N-terminal domain-containing protein n=1 Tax=Haloferax mediterranei (strain ATCC 33500 / DSM 1411 / JCM 8866 / NBRC 14739 / NCIMB 2177 / R-4) TaxID=523841 RepID=M0IST6_HALMT|nr:hypothetical protein C439_12554 [Haloferax mediterranei ATCC 33500]